MTNRQRLSRTQAIEVWSRKELGDDLYTWQFYIQGSEAEEEKTERVRAALRAGTNIQYITCPTAPGGPFAGLLADP